MAKRIKPKKKNQGSSGQLSPKKYVQTQAKKLPLGECFITEDWEQMGLANVIVSRVHTTGNITYGIYLVDTYCLGIKDTFFDFNITQYEFRDRIAQMREDGLVPCAYALAHNVIIGGLEYAEDLGLAPHKDFAITEHLLEDDDDVEFIPLTFGYNGMPQLVVNHNQPRDREMAILNRTVGPLNYDVVFLDEFGDPIESDEDEYGDADFEDPVKNLLQIFEAVDQAYEKHFPEEIKEAEARFTEEMDYYITEGPSTKHMEDELIDTLNDLAQLKKEDPQGAIPLIEKAIETYPEEPILHNFLASIYDRLGDEQKAIELRIAIYERFPDFILGVIPFYLLMIDDGKIEELDQLLEGKWDITLFQPERSTFSIQEVYVYYMFMIQYSLVKDQLIWASIYLAAIPQEQLKDEEQVMILFELAMKICEDKMKKVLGDHYVENDMTANLAALVAQGDVEASDLPKGI
ncbi:MAG: tetratricopeptide repeat protein [Flammeovirgaceae bacterium]